jgi:hypothetical protein
MKNKNTERGGYRLRFATRFAPSSKFPRTRAFIGLAAGGASLVSGEPNRGTLLVGMGYDPEEDDEEFWHVIYSDDEGAVRRIPVYVAPRNTTDVYDLRILSADDGTKIVVDVTNHTTGEVSTIDILSSLPSASELVYIQSEVAFAYMEEAVALGLAQTENGKEPRRRSVPPVVAPEG